MSDLSSTRSARRKVGILSPGEMGVALGDVLRSEGHETLSTIAGRSSRTIDLATASHMTLLPSIADVVASCDIVISTVTPQTSVLLAEQVASELARQKTSSQPQPLIYVDVNSVAPHTVSQVAAALADSGADLIDAAIHGLASRLTTQGTIYASGAQAETFCELFGDQVRTCSLGPDVGRASLMKMMLGGMSKGIVGLFIQSALLAESADVTSAFCAELKEYFPDVLNFVQRSLPTYPVHAPRRVQEMRELSQTLEQAGLRPDMSLAAARVFETLAKSDLADATPHTETHTPLDALIKTLFKTHNVHTQAASLSRAC